MNAQLKRLLAEAELDKAILKEAGLGKLLSPAKRRRRVEHVRDARAERRYPSVMPAGCLGSHVPLSAASGMSLLMSHFQFGEWVKLASEYGRYGYRRIMALLRRKGCTVNHRRVERLWRHEGLKVPARQPKLKRLWLGNGSCDRLRPAFKNHALELRLCLFTDQRWTATAIAHTDR